jgi:hypothetical protein
LDYLSDALPIGLSGVSGRNVQKSIYVAFDDFIEEVWFVANVGGISTKEKHF